MPRINSLAYHLSLTGTAAPVQTAALENIKKCKNFLTTLIKLASSQPKDTVQNVRTLIQGLIVSTQHVHGTAGSSSCVFVAIDDVFIYDLILCTIFDLVYQFIRMVKWNRKISRTSYRSFSSPRHNLIWFLS